MATRWGICSTGKICHDFTVALRTLLSGDHQIVAVAARKLQDAEAFAKKHNIPRAYGSYDELARDAEVEYGWLGINLKRLTADTISGAVKTPVWQETDIKHNSCKPTPTSACLKKNMKRKLTCSEVVYVGAIHPCHLSLSLLFMNSSKNVLCEKPMAMNSQEVQQMVACAKANGVFLMEAVWTRFFPATLEIKRLLAEGEVGEVKLVRAEFGAALGHVPRAVEKELGGGALLDIGIYCLQFICMVYAGEKPESVRATGVCLDTGVDEAMVVTMKFSRNRMAVFTCSVAVDLLNDAIISGTKGSIRVPAHMWCPTSLEVNGRRNQYPLPEPYMPLNFINSTGMRYEAEEVRQCLLKGLRESPGMSLADSLLLAELEDEARRQVGVVYSQDRQ